MNIQNNASGGTNGTNVIITNSGGLSGRSLDNVNTTAVDASVTFSNIVSRGNLAYKFSTTATTAVANVEWKQALTQVNTFYLRFYLYLPTFFGSPIRILQVDSVGGSPAVLLNINAAGRLVVRDATDTNAIATNTTTLPLRKWVRVEMKCVLHASTGSVELYTYHEPDSVRYTERRLSTSTFNTNGSPLFRITWGLQTFGTTNYTCYLDDIAVSNTAYLGPINPTYTFDPTLINSAEGGTNTTVVTYDNSGNESGNIITPSVSGTSTVLFSSTTAAHGSLSYLVQNNSSDYARLVWQMDPAVSVGSTAARSYVYFGSFPSSTTAVIASVETTNTFRASIAVTSTGNIEVSDSAGVLWTSSTPISTSTWTRVELVTVIGTTSSNGTVKAAFYTGDSTTALGTFTSTTANTGTVSIDKQFFGKVGPNTWTGNHYMDDLAVLPNSSNFIGPYSAPVAPAAYSVVYPYGWGNQI